MKQTELWPGGPGYMGEAFSADSLVLADFAAALPGRRAADLGCGCGILMLLLTAARPELAVDGVELRPAAAAACRENLIRNGLSDRCRVVCDDLRARPLPAGAYDLVVSNPPYFPAGGGGVSPRRDRALMRTECASLPELCAAAEALLSPGGRFCLVHRRERMAEVLSALTAAGLTPVRRRDFRPRREVPGRVFLLEALKGAGGELREEPPLCQFGPEGAETAEYRKICHWE